MMNSLKAYVSILRVQLAAGFQFRAAFWAKMATNAFWGVIRATIFYVFLRYGAGGGSEMGIVQTASYIWLGQILLNLLPGYGTDTRVLALLRSGDVSCELIRPLDVYFHWYWRSTAVKLAPFLCSVIPITLLAIFMPEGLRLSPPASAAGFVCFLTTLATGVLLSGACISLTYPMMMRVEWGEGHVNLLNTVMSILGGAYVPLSFWPEAMQRVLFYQPFAGMLDLPARFYIGTLEPKSVFGVLAVQLLWTVILVALGKLWLGHSLKRVTLQGG